MEELLRIKKVLDLAKNDLENDSGTIKEGCRYRWNSIIRDLGIIEDAIELMEIYKIK